jgi:cell wall-associated NlpC family hydrolase
MTLAEQYVENCRTWLGVRFRHQGRNRNGVDCVGLVIMAAYEIGIATGAEKVSGYSRQPNQKDFDHWCGKFCDKLPYNRLHGLGRQLEVGDLISFWIEDEGIPRHIAVYTGVDSQGRQRMIHSYAKENRGVVEMPIDPSYWKQRVSGLYRYRDFN